MADSMTPQEAAKVARRLQEESSSWYSQEWREALTILADLADPPKPKAEWETAARRVVRNGMCIAVSYDNTGNFNDYALAAHRAVVAMHALRADEEGMDVVALIEEARR